VLISDGVITAGVEGRDLQRMVQQLAGAVDRLDVVLVGGLRDDRVAALLVDAGLPHAGAVLDLATDPVATALGEAVSTEIPVDLPAPRGCIRARSPAPGPAPG